MDFMERRLTYVVFAEDGAFIARCLDVEITSDGDTEQTAVANLQEALELYFEGRGSDLAALPSRAYRCAAVAIPVRR
jgi:predicted RNase H-like HicB family nuclease